MAYHEEAVGLLSAWCEWLHAFRHCRTDRIEASAFLDGRFGQPADLRPDRQLLLEAQCGARLP